MADFNFDYQNEKLTTDQINTLINLINNRIAKRRGNVATDNPLPNNIGVNYGGIDTTAIATVSQNDFIETLPNGTPILTNTKSVLQRLMNKITLVRDIGVKELPVNSILYIINSEELGGGIPDILSPVNYDTLCSKISELPSELSGNNVEVNRPENSGCRAACTGFCAGACIGTCNGCQSCTGVCSGSCSTACIGTNVNKAFGRQSG